MEQPPSRLASLTLVSKYYPVANYSYPRNESCSRSGSIAIVDRSSYGSEGSAPGLVEDRTDSEASTDDDYQYHTNTAELWDSFWNQRAEKPKRDLLEIHPKKQYPALIPSPQRRKGCPLEGAGGKVTLAWPLPELPAQKNRSRQPAASYSPFPKPIALPPRGRCPAPSWQNSRPRECPKRPSRPDEDLLAPCLPQPSPVKAVFPSSIKALDTTKEISTITPQPSSPVERPSTSMGCPSSSSVPQQRPTTPPEMQRPKTSHAARPSVRAVSPTEQGFPAASIPRTHGVITSYDAQRSMKPSEGRRPSTPRDLDSPTLFSLASFSSNPETQKSHRHTKSQPSHHRSRSRLTPEPPKEPQSVFEDDSDCEDSIRSFFRFHKRSGSDIRRSARNSARNSDSSSSSGPQQTRRRTRASTAPSSPVRQHHQQHHQQPERKRNPVEVLSCMLGRRGKYKDYEDDSDYF